MAQHVTYRRADEAELELLADVIGEHYPHLGADDYAIELIFRDIPQTVGGRKCAATANVCSPSVAFLAGYDAWIEVCEQHWRDGEEWQRYLLDHELAHFGIHPKTGRLMVVSHDIEDFEDVLLRHGEELAMLRQRLECGVPHYAPDT